VRLRDLIEGRFDMDLRLLGLILTVTGAADLAVTYTRGANLGISRRTALMAGIALLVLGLALLAYTAAGPQ
jgi:hypothetical protein